jgi:cytochrome oxidase assembly protein ShyY1
MSICVLPLLLLLLGLGFWQLARGEEKARLQQLQLDRLSALAVAPPAQVQGADFLRVRIRGAFERGKYFLVDNQVLNGRAGYWVLHSFQAIDGGRWLVNRGWVDAGARRTELPEVAEPAGTVELMGVCWPDLGLLPILSDEVWSGGWPKRVPRMNIPAMADMLGAEPVEVRLEPGQPGRLGALPMSVALDAHRHRGYAVQWFGLALILLAGYVLHGYRGLAGNRA